MSGERLIRVGRIVGVYGVSGWIKLESDTDPRRNIFRYAPWTIVQRGVSSRVDAVEGREHGKGLVAHWPELATRDHAEALIGAEILVPRAVLPDSAPGEYYWVDLEGLRVLGVDGFDFGRISHLFSTGANDVMSVLGERERLVPFLRGEVVKDVDLDAGLVRIDWDPEF